MVTAQEAEDYARALNRAVAMLARRPCSKKEIRDRLKRTQFPDETVDLVIYKLEKENLLDDEAFCAQWIRYRLSGRYGPALIRRELRLKGITDDIIESSFSCLDEEEEQNNAVTLARKAWKRAKSTDDKYKTRQKIISFLVRKGYKWETARSACYQAEEKE